MDFLSAVLLILAAFGVVLLLSVYFNRRRTEQHDNSFTSRTETPHVASCIPSRYERGSVKLNGGS